MTHEGILKINEFFNNKLAKATDKIRVQITYIGNFGNQQLFQGLRKVVRRAGYQDVKGQIDTLFCLVEGLKSGDINEATITAALSAGSRAYLPTRNCIDIFIKILQKGKLTFDDRIRRDNMLAMYLTSSNFCIKTNFYTLAEQKKLYKELIEPLLSVGMFIGKSVGYKIESRDLYEQVYNNAKAVITNMNSRGMSTFAIACYFWFWNKHLIPKPFMHHWSGNNFISALMTTPIYKTEANEVIKNALTPSKPYWLVISELSAMTGKIANIDERRKALNEIINKVLASEGEEYLKEYLTKIKLVASQNPIQTETMPFGSSAIRNIEKDLQNNLRDRSTKVPSKELIVESMKYQFMISRILDVDFSSKRKDHIVFDKATRKRVFDIL